MRPFKVGDRVEQKDDYLGYTTKKGWQGTVVNIYSDYINVDWDKFKEFSLNVKDDEIYLLQPDGEKSVKEDASKDVHETKTDKGWGF